MRHLLSAAILVFAATPAFAQKYDPPPAKAPDAATLKQIEERTAKLKAAIDAVMQRKDLPKYLNGDLDVYDKAAEWIVRHQEWFTADSGKQTLAVIDQGMKRVEALKEGKTLWIKPGCAVARGFHSYLDGSVQPYGVVYPEDYGKDKNKKWRLDIVLHGRDSSLTEVKFLNQHDGRPAPKGLDHVQLNIYGRGNNAYRWAGESDVFEAFLFFMTADFLHQNAQLIDQNKIVLKGFSMGGAGTWHIGLRKPGMFAAIQPGAGFTTTHGYIAKLPETLPDYQEKCLRVYDAYRYAENAFNVPIVAYSGEIDPQRKAAENIAAELKRLGLGDRMTHLIGPGLEHKFPPEWQKNVEAVVRENVGENGRAKYPKHVRFVTYTLKQDRCDWVEILGLEKHYDRAVVDAEWKPDGEHTFVLTTSNVSRFRLKPEPGQTFPAHVTIDRKVVNLTVDGPSSLEFVKDPAGWRAVKSDPEAIRSAKHPRVQGPIDDAFTSAFLCVVGTGKPNHPAMSDAAVVQLERFRREWDKYMRSTVVVKKDTEVSDDDRKNKNLILFGDPGSNSLIAKAMEKMPFEWTRDSLQFEGKKHDPATYLPILIQPSPFGRDRYVVFNSGHTFHEADFKGTNALLYPRLGDYAVVKPTPTDKDPAAFEVITAGLFDENWQFPKK